LTYFEEVLVGSLAAVPILRSLDVQPDAAVEVRFAVIVQVVHKLSHLSGGTL